MLKIIWNDIKRSFTNREFITRFCCRASIYLMLFALLLYSLIQEGHPLYSIIWWIKGLLIIACLGYAYIAAWEKTFYDKEKE